jgi:signal transduction histidine kinase
MTGWLKRLISGRLAYLLVEPSPAIEDRIERRKARMLSTFLIGIVPMGGLSSLIRVWLDPGYVEAFRFQAALYVLSIGVYLVSRTRHVLVATVLLLALGDCMAIGLIIQRPYDLLLHATPLVPILLASVLLTWRSTALFAMANLLAMAAIGWLLPEAAAIHIWTTITFVAVCAAVVVVAARFQVALERERQLDLQFTDRMAAIGTLAAGVAHEINNPLTYVRGNLDLIEEALREVDTTSDHALAEKLAASIESLSRVERIVGDLRTFARPDVDGTGPADLQEVFDSVLDMVVHQLRHSGSVSCEIPEDIPRVQASEARMAQVFLNLLVNAMHSFEEHDPDRNEVRISACVGEQGFVSISVVDNGAGIAQDDLSRVFSPFFTTKPPGVGTGLGLSVCRNIVEAAGGEIRVESTLGEGSCFTVTLPAALPEEVPAPREIQDVASPLAGTNRAKRRILIIDDEPAIVEMLKDLFVGHQVTVALNGTDAIDRLERAEYDVILCDLMMPVVSGIDVFERTVPGIPGRAGRFIFVTGGAFTDRARDFLAEVKPQWVQKPFQLDELRLLVEQQLHS